MAHLKTIQPKRPEMVERAFRPSVHFDSSQLPAIKNWEVGKTYTVTLKVTQTSKHINEHGKFSGSFDILAVGSENGKQNKRENA